MKQRLRLCAALVVWLFLIPGGVVAQEAIGMELSAGIGGYVDPFEPLRLSVAISAPVLVTGRIQVTFAGSVLEVPVEIPAGSAKTFEIVGPPLNGQAVRVHLYGDGVEKPLISKNLQLRMPRNQLLVGTFDLADAVNDRIETTVTEIAMMDILQLQVGDLDGPFRPLAYLVVTDVGTPTDALAAWIGGGGRLITERIDLGGLDVDPIGNIDGAVSYLLGEGEISVVSDIRSPEISWPSLLRPVPTAGNVTDSWATPERALSQAASYAGGNQAPSVPWLLGAMLGYALVVGPINLFILKRMKRRELAWVTIPVIALVALVGFWAAGRQRLAATELTHATVIIPGKVGMERRSVVVLASGQAGRHSMNFPDDAIVYPTGLNVFNEFGAPVSNVIATVSGSAVDFQLGKLAYGAVHSLEAGPDVPDLVPSEKGFSVTNDTDLTFSTWGLGSVTNGARVGQGTLDPGESVELALPSQAGFFGTNIGDQIVQARQMWNDPTAWQVLYPLGEAIQYAAPAVDQFFFGYIENYRFEVEVDGVVRSVSGPAMVMVAAAGGERDRGIARAELLSAGEAGSVSSGGPGFTYVNGTEFYVSARVPTDLSRDPQFQYGQDFGPPPRRFHAWDWQNHTFVEVSIGEDLDREIFVSPSGEVIFWGDNETEGAEQQPQNFVEMFSYSPQSLRLEWER